ncbi:MAG: hypothetical protein EBR99_03245, partial [Actinobacteria bacterium]|nr:hypothetical protein [Actinomycetota bacterium]
SDKFAQGTIEAATGHLNARVCSEVYGGESNVRIILALDPEVTRQIVLHEAPSIFIYGLTT